MVFMWPRWTRKNGTNQAEIRETELIIETGN